MMIGILHSSIQTQISVVGFPNDLNEMERRGYIFGQTRYEIERKTVEPGFRALFYYLPSLMHLIL